MKKMFKYGVMLLGASAIITGTSSCDKDKDSTKCCTFKYDDGDTEKICEDDEDFKEYDLTWSEFSKYAESIEGSYGIDDVKCD